MSITFTTSSNGRLRGVQGMTLACHQPATGATPAVSTSACGTGKTTARFRSIREFIEWLILGMFLGCALNMKASVTDYKPSAARPLVKGSQRIAPPSVVLVDGRAYTLRMIDNLFDPDGNSLDGTTDTKMAIIDIRKGQDLASEVDTVLHEILHACMNQTIRNYEKKKFLEEDAVAKITPRLLKVIRENPALMEYLTQ